MKPHMHAHMHTLFFLFFLSSLFLCRDKKQSNKKTKITFFLSLSLYVCGVLFIVSHCHCHFLHEPGDQRQSETTVV